MNSHAKKITIGGSVSIASLVGAIWFIVALDLKAEDNEVRSIQNKAVVEQLAEIAIKKASADEAKREQLKSLCLAGIVKSRRECATVGVKVEP